MTHLNLTGSFFASKLPSEISHLETPSLKRPIQNLTHLTKLVLDVVNMSSVSPNLS